MMADAVQDKIIFRSLYSQTTSRAMRKFQPTMQLSWCGAARSQNILVVERSRPTSARQFSFQKIRFIACVSWTKNVSTDLNVNRTWFHFPNQLGTWFRRANDFLCIYLQTFTCAAIAFPAVDASKYLNRGGAGYGGQFIHSYLYP